MAKVLKKPPTYEVIVDSNALFVQDPRKLVSGGFESALLELRKITAVNLYVPQVVLGELAFQKWLAAEAALKSAEKNLATVSATTGLNAPSLPSTDKARRSIEHRFKQWCANVQASILRPKMGKIEWERLLNDAIWRIGPFERSEDGKHEKGFRDRVIFEAIEQFCRGAKNEVIVLSKDGLLTDRLKSCGAKLSVYPRLEDFASRVRLTKDQEESEWANELFAAATVAFYAAANPDCIYLREKVGETLLARTADLIPPSGSVGLFSLTPANWDRLTDERITLHATRFETRNNGRWEWNTEVTVAAAFSGKDLIDLVHEQIRVSTFTVSWSCPISDAAEIQNARLDGISLKERLMVNDTPEERQKWSLQAKSAAGQEWLEHFKRRLSETPSSNK